MAKIDIDKLYMGFLPWLKLQDPNATFSYKDNYGCAFAQYLKYQGFPYCSVGGSTFSLHHQLKDHKLPDVFKMALLGIPGIPSTFGNVARMIEESTYNEH